MKILVTGASGLVGTYVVEKSLLQGHETFASHHNFKPAAGDDVSLDLLNTKEMGEKIRQISPDAIIHCAANSDINFCESEKDIALKINSVGTQELCKSISDECFFLYVSTDNVFDGEKGLYNESDKPNPVNWYGETKVKAEEIVKNQVKNWAIARISTQYGIHERRSNLGFDFLKKFVKGEVVKAVSDFYSSPTYVKSTASMLVEIVEREISGVLHICDNDRTSRWKFASSLKDLIKFGHEKKIIQEISIKDLKWKAKRPQDSSLDNSRSKKILHIKPLSLKEGLKQFLTDYQISF